MPADEEEFDAMEEYEDFVPAVYARSRDDAERYREILEDPDTPVGMGDEDEKGKARRKGMARGTPILVPEPLLDEASEIIADLEDDEEFQDLDDDEEVDEDDELGLGEGLDDGFVEEEDDELGFDDEEDDLFEGLDDEEEGFDEDFDEH